MFQKNKGCHSISSPFHLYSKVQDSVPLLHFHIGNYLVLQSSSFHKLLASL